MNETKNRPTVPFDTKPAGSLKFLYTTLPGRVVLKLFTRRFISKLDGWYMNRRFSARKIPGFIQKNNMDMSAYPQQAYPTFNAFFTRPIDPAARPVDRTPSHLISPCDGKLSVYPVGADSRFPIKGSFYSVSELLNGDPVAENYRGGWCLIFRLAVDDYHRYCYIDSGIKSDNVFIKGILHTVQPLVLDRYNIYRRNCREYTVIETENFGRVVQCEVGALMVGRIVNYHGAGPVSRGDEKGMFEFGGSTVVVLLEPGVAEIQRELVENTENGFETKVKMGEWIGGVHS